MVYVDEEVLDEEAGSVVCLPNHDLVSSVDDEHLLEDSWVEVFLKRFEVVFVDQPVNVLIS